MTTTLGAAMAGGNPTLGRVKDEFYPTPNTCTIGLMELEQHFIRSHTDCVWECACGDGKMSDIIDEYGFTVISTDLVDRGYGSQMDFLATTAGKEKVAIVTNPPFNLAPQFIEHAIGYFEVPYLALLLKSTFWHAKRRLPLFRKYPPSVIYPMTWRPDFMNRGAPTMDCSWMIWDVSRPGTMYIPMEHPRV